MNPNSLFHCFSTIMYLRDNSGWFQLFHLTDKTGVFIFMGWDGKYLKSDHVRPGGDEIEDHTVSFLVDSNENSK